MVRTEVRSSDFSGSAVRIRTFQVEISIRTQVRISIIENGAKSSPPDGHFPSPKEGSLSKFPPPDKRGLSLGGGREMCFFQREASYNRGLFFGGERLTRTSARPCSDVGSESVFKGVRILFGAGPEKSEQAKKNPNINSPYHSFSPGLNHIGLALMVIRERLRGPYAKEQYTRWTEKFFEPAGGFAAVMARPLLLAILLLCL